MVSDEKILLLIELIEDEVINPTKNIDDLHKRWRIFKLSLKDRVLEKAKKELYI